ncbi:MAG: tRNA (adenosine(37)-N6)-threonylcarbamoyltransferase complex dimerization subunit type 1 TsaB [Sphingobacteriales bacterium]|jgi:tRNA threonylcarbamoyladenosine biosynthesis protein TsaB
MSMILHIHTGLEKAYVAVSKDLECLSYRANEFQKDHGSFLQPAIQDIILEAKSTLHDLDAISVMNGPGSYTGLRVGLSAAKGLCYALKKPLICLSTLEWLAWPFKNKEADLICSLIDARRMEVFTAMYQKDMSVYIPEHPEIIDENSFSEIKDNRILFTGNGRNKLPKQITLHKNVLLPDHISDIQEQIEMTLKRFTEGKFNELAYTEPNYGKAFYTTAKV